MGLNALISLKTRQLITVGSFSLCGYFYGVLLSVTYEAFATYVTLRGNIVVSTLNDPGISDIPPLNRRSLSLRVRP